MINSNKIIKRFITGALQGNFFGLIVTLTGSYISGNSEFIVSRFNNQNIDILIAMIVWCLIGGIAGLSSLIFDYTDWGITKTTCIQFLISYFPALAMAILVNWFPFKLDSIIVFSIIYATIFFIIWFISMKSTKNDIKQLNQKLQHKKF
ncbi:DUF3021 domain-containing protein [Holzapfeliella sp. He02]|uniref:DUF3021 domain-containing protein n=1 Tax=Holzapfeliella saturejae TaxID=3082953 RepID=A0ABU8SJY4_9LACO